MSIDAPVFALDTIMALIAPPVSATSRSNSRKRSSTQNSDSRHFFHNSHAGGGHKKGSFHSNKNISNHEFCDTCREGGNLLCCDMCPSAFHFFCHDPPLDPEKLPEGEWVCRKCKPPNIQFSSKGVFRDLTEKLTKSNSSLFSLPYSYTLNDNFPGDKRENVPKRADGSLITIPVYPECDRRPGDRTTRDTCFFCNRDSQSGRLILCDFCPLVYHTDCLDPPLTKIPYGLWMCPCHPHHAVPDFLHPRLTKRAAVMEKFRVPIDQHAIKLTFINKMINEDILGLNNSVSNYYNRVKPTNVPNSIKELYESPIQEDSAPSLLETLYTTFERQMLLANECDIQLPTPCGIPRTRENDNEISDLIMKHIDESYITQDSDTTNAMQLEDTTLQTETLIHRCDEDDEDDDDDSILALSLANTPSNININCTENLATPIKQLLTYEDYLLSEREIPLTENATPQFNTQITKSNRLLSKVAQPLKHLQQPITETSQMDKIQTPQSESPLIPESLSFSNYLSNTSVFSHQQKESTIETADTPELGVTSSLQLQVEPNKNKFYPNGAKFPSAFEVTKGNILGTMDINKNIVMPSNNIDRIADTGNMPMQIDDEVFKMHNNNNSNSNNNNNTTTTTNNNNNNNNDTNNNNSKLNDNTNSLLPDSTTNATTTSSTTNNNSNNNSINNRTKRRQEFLPIAPELNKLQPKLIEMLALQRLRQLYPEASICRSANNSNNNTTTTATTATTAAATNNNNNINNNNTTTSNTNNTNPLSELLTTLHQNEGSERMDISSPYLGLFRTRGETSESQETTADVGITNKSHFSAATPAIPDGLFIPVTGLGKPIRLDRRTITIGTDSDMHINLRDYGQCGYVSKHHASIYYDRITGDYELLNYSSHGTIVDKTYYSSESHPVTIPSGVFPRRNDLPFSITDIKPLSISHLNERSRRHSTITRDHSHTWDKDAGKHREQLLVTSIDIPIDNEVLVESGSRGQLSNTVELPTPLCQQPDINHTYNDDSMKCNCTATDVNIYTRCIGWEGLAKIAHGSEIKFGCLRFMASLSGHPGHKELIAKIDSLSNNSLHLHENT